ncbi:hypothetical protein EYC84_005066 [Monilinia fructicola]|uniref:Uncharacterized protein n=1 Tax=Monilinia fructicola TaxID=38448 RepID=A0A5M9JWA7_MONFR|nr:hypothetical protein EYC84_005066 [Monilinia fructicola]
MSFPDDFKSVKASNIAEIDSYQDKAASKDSQLKAIWDEQMGAKNIAVAYRQAHVLLLSWHPEDDDLHVDQEVSNLRVRLGEVKGALNLTGTSTLNPGENKEIHEVVWNSAENNIRHTRSDVLVIFDCCNAGEMNRNVRGSDFTRRAFEYIAATSQGSTTKKPGPESFTSALIWALKYMIKHKPGRRFSTTELVNKIYHAPKLPEDQAPRLIEGSPIGCLRKIVLGPLDEKSLTGVSNGINMERINETNDTLSVRFVFTKTINKRMIQDLSKDLSNLIGQGDFGASTILWDGINSPGPETKRIRDIINHWQNQTKKQTRTSFSSFWAVFKPHPSHP